MPRRVFLLSFVALVLLGGFVISSGVLNEPLPSAPVAGSASESLTTPTRYTAAEDRIQLVPRAPRAAEQDPNRSPEFEPAPPVWKDTPGGVTHVRVPTTLQGRYDRLSGKEKAPKGQTTYSITIEVEEGLPVTPQEFSSFVMKTLNHRKSWAKDGQVTFSRTDKNPDLRVILASPNTVDRECAPLETNGRWSCGTNGKAMINAERWINGAEAFLEAGGDILEYRRYLINHEVGHLIGHGHESCPGSGKKAPVMVQQSISVEGCEPNGWVHP